MEKTKKLCKTQDLELFFLLQLDAELEGWRVLAAAWLAKQKRAITEKKSNLEKFIANYVHALGLPKFPVEFLAAAYNPPCFYDSLKGYKQRARVNNNMIEFLDWVLENYFSMEDDHGNLTIAPGFRNPLKRRKDQGGYFETNKAPLPSRFIRELRHILCPPDARSFLDWTWAIENAIDGSTGGDWFKVDPASVDQNDPDCVWRRRTVPVYKKTSKLNHNYQVGEEEIVELWSPVRWVALYIKLELPLRTGQVRWLDSGETDTWRYQGGDWVENLSSLARGTKMRPHQKGVFRRARDPDTGADLCALYINTNKTADIDKAEDAKGYVVPWEHPRALPWLERLRNWQAKYNPISAPTPWTNLEKKHLGQIKHPEILDEMGEACFLFRAAQARKESDRDKPLGDMDIQIAWRRLLNALEVRCVARDETLPNGQKIRFVIPDVKVATEFPLHSLRVSLITCYALEGEVPIAILSKCIAGHARILMTLYYTKAGVGRVTEVMEEAERKMLEKDKAADQRQLFFPVNDN